MNYIIWVGVRITIRLANESTHNRSASMQNHNIEIMTHVCVHALQYVVYGNRLYQDYILPSIKSRDARADGIHPLVVTIIFHMIILMKHLCYYKYCLTLTFHTSHDCILRHAACFVFVVLCKNENKNKIVSWDSLVWGLGRDYKRNCGHLAFEHRVIN